MMVMPSEMRSYWADATNPHVVPLGTPVVLCGIGPTSSGMLPRH